MFKIDKSRFQTERHLESSQNELNSNNKLLQYYFDQTQIEQ